MTDYTKTTTFITKDGLASGNAAKLIKGADHDVEFDAIAVAVATKANSASPTITSPTLSGTILSDSSIVFEGATADAFETTLTVTDPTADRTWTIPDAASDTFVGKATTDTLTNKTLTTPVLNGAITGTSLVDSDTMVGVAADTLCSGESIKAYVDSQTTGVIETKYKTADESITADTTLTDDTHLLGWTVDAASFYKIDGHIQMTSQEGGTALTGLKCKFTLDNAAISSGVMYTTGNGVEDLSPVTASYADVTTETALAIAISVGTAASMQVTGYIKTHASSSASLDFQWAQMESKGDTLDLLTGSWITLTKMT